MEAQRTMRETPERLAASQKMDAVGWLTGGIAHDFNNLMMVVLEIWKRRNATRGKLITPTSTAHSPMRCGVLSVRPL